MPVKFVKKYGPKAGVKKSKTVASPNFCSQPDIASASVDICINQANKKIEDDTGKIVTDGDIDKPTEFDASKDINLEKIKKEMKFAIRRVNGGKKRTECQHMYRVPKNYCDE